MRRKMPGYYWIILFWKVKIKQIAGLSAPEYDGLCPGLLLKENDLQMIRT